MSNLFGRLMALLLALMWLPRVGLFDWVRLPMRVWLTDIDLNGHLNNGRYLALMDLGRVQLLGQAGLLPILWRRKWSPVAQAVEIRYIRDLKPLRRFVLETRLLGWDDKYWYIEQRFCCGQQVHAVALVRGLFLQGHRKISNQELAQLAGVPAESPELPIAVQRWRNMRELSE